MDPLQELTTLAKGLKCTEVAHYASYSWSFDFEGKFRLNVQCPWRLVDESGIRVGGEDDGQRFGLPAPVDAAKRAMDLLSVTWLKEVIVARKTGDICLEFASGARLEVFNNSSGYEGWNCGTPSGLQIIGMGGGGIHSINPGA
jgi:Family of unknown function (DUF6188)